MLIVKDTGKRYGSFNALREINLEFGFGIYGLLAPNGAGKTTLMKMLATLISPTSGEILYNGSDIYELDESYRDILGYLPQNFGFYKHYSPKQYLMYLSALKGIDKKTAAGLITDLLEKVALSDVANKKMRKFSGGMIQRVGIAQALLNDPKILILDEPTAGLDPKERARFRQLLTSLSRDRLIIISTHIVSDIESIANQVIMLKHQEILFNAPPQSICKTLDGNIYETVIGNQELEAFRLKYTLLGEKQELGNVRVRFVHKGEQQMHWMPVSPNLEDVFLYEYRDDLSGDSYVL
ncbi:ABC transporter ATP-binding protein [Falsibacillus pallidus]|uniref:ABC-type multidrug transport system ATPase subunit n=1 Tax=Falsibacillus pallidus TaxID=493781 RepID=A0A370GHF2_9BACI|nr:ABC transporter ATP-binding protein [Falsibacillus pallidus]RDI41353.1 ABC-type multidrug transport system ATPase subunit [Falsibacillus pallidus]